MLGKSPPGNVHGTSQLLFHTTFSIVAVFAWDLSSFHFSFPASFPRHHFPLKRRKRREQTFLVFPLVEGGRSPRSTSLAPFFRCASRCNCSGANRVSRRSHRKVEMGRRESRNDPGRLPRFLLCAKKMDLQGHDGVCCAVGEDPLPSIVLFPKSRKYIPTRVHV